MKFTWQSIECELPPNQEGQLILNGGNFARVLINRSMGWSRFLAVNGIVAVANSEFEQFDDRYL